jgi:hypothetical protein
MLIVRLVTSLGMNVLQCMGDFASWMLECCAARTQARAIGDVSRAYGRFRCSEDVGEGSGEALAARFTQYSRAEPQTRTVAALLNKMRNVKFLGKEHLDAERLVNMFTNPPTKCDDDDGQRRVLELDKIGLQTIEYHLSVPFPSAFGALSEGDIHKGFDGAKYRKRTKKRRVETVGKLQRKHGTTSRVVSIRRSSRSSMEKLHNARRRDVAAMKDSL